MREYLIDLNASAAARRAGYSAHRADAIGHENLRKPEIANALSIAMEQRAERTKIDSDWVLRTLAEEKAADLADMYDEAGNLKPIKEWPMAFRRGVVVGVETVEEWTGVGEDRKPIQIRKVKMTDRTKHLELIGKHVNVQAFRDNVGLSDAEGKALLPTVIQLVAPDDKRKA